MASSSNHLKQWTHNREFLPLIPSQFTDWLVTVAFYTALHAVDALLAEDNVPGIVSHAARNIVLSRTNRYSFICKRYLPFFDLSQTIRYLAEPGRWVPFGKVESDVFGRYLYPIENSVAGLLKNATLTSVPIHLAIPSGS